MCIWVSFFFFNQYIIYSIIFFNFIFDVLKKTLHFFPELEPNLSTILDIDVENLLHVRYTWYQQDSNYSAWAQVVVIDYQLKNQYLRSFWVNPRNCCRKLKIMLALWFQWLHTPLTAIKTINNKCNLTINLTINMHLSQHRMHIIFLSTNDNVQSPLDYLIYSIHNL